MNDHLYESSQCELKETIPEKGQILKTCVAFCNTHGGKLIIGVQDNGNIIGVSEEQIQASLEFLNKQIFDSCTPSILPKIYSSSMEGKSVLVIEVNSGMNKPYFLSTKGIQEGCYVRIGRSTMKATPNLIQELQWQGRGVSFDTLPNYASLTEDLDMGLLNSFMHFIGEEEVKDLPRFLESHTLTVSEHGRTYLSNAASLLFCRNPQRFHSEAFIIASRFKGLEGREAIDSRDFTGPLTQQIDSAISFILSHIGVRFSMGGTQRKESPTLPTVAIREAVINAVVHRNYHTPAPAKIAIYENRVEVFNPGGFPSPIPMADFRMGISHIRNIVIARLLRRMGYVEKLGSGLLNIIDSCRESGLLRPEIIDGGNYTKIILFKDLVDASEKNELDFEAQNILRYIQESRSVTAKEVASVLKLSKSTVNRKLNFLCERGTLIKSGKARSVRYSFLQE